jgi:dihydroorotase
MSKIVILKNTKLLNEQGELFTTDIKIVEGIIAEIAENIASEGEIIDAKGLFVSAGFIDVHVHLREPGLEYKETIQSGSMAAAKGGFTTICPMPNTKPVPDRAERFDDLLNRIKASAVVNIKPYGAITEDSKGEKLNDYKLLKDKGAVAFSDDGVGVQEAGVMYKAMQKIVEVDLPIAAHCEDNSLILGGCIHDGDKAKELGLKGIPSVCESVQIARDILLAEATGAHYHVCHVSSKESVRVIADAKKAGIRVTAEVSPHHLVLTEDDIPNADTNYKMNPPLRAKADQLALIKALEDGVIDCIATDHAPHTDQEKAKGMYDSPFGIVGFETAFPVLFTKFVKTNKWTLKQLTDWMTIKPAEIFKLNSIGKIKIGFAADLTIINLNDEIKVDKNTFISKGKNTPFDGWACYGWPVMTLVNGKVVYKNQQYFN